MPNGVRSRFDFVEFINIVGPTTSRRTRSAEQRADSESIKPVKRGKKKSSLNPAIQDAREPADVQKKSSGYRITGRELSRECGKLRFSKVEIESETISAPLENPSGQFLAIERHPSYLRPWYLLLVQEEDRG